MLIGRQAFAGAEMIAHILSAALVANVHFVPASRAPDDAVQQKIAVARRASGFGAHVFCPIVSCDGADLFIGRPVDVGGIPILQRRPWACASDHRRKRPHKPDSSRLLLRTTPSLASSVGRPPWWRQGAGPCYGLPRRNRPRLHDHLDQVMQSRPAAGRYRFRAITVRVSIGTGDSL